MAVPQGVVESFRRSGICSKEIFSNSTNTVRDAPDRNVILGGSHLRTLRSINHSINQHSINLLQPN
jgi:hypothetical protein